MVKIISTIENWLVDGIWLPIKEEVEVLEENLSKYLSLAGVKVVETAVEHEIEAKVEDKINTTEETE